MVLVRGAIKRFVGLSTDTKPTDCPPGSTFEETNTGYRFVFDGSNWDAGVIYGGLLEE